MLPISMLSVAEARARILAGLRPTSAETVPLSAAWGRVTAAPILARLDQPPHDLSAMDGYALRGADGMADAVLRVVGHAPAGHPWQGRVGPGEAVRLFTGSVMPDGADCVLLQEDAAAGDGTVTVREAVSSGRHVRAKAQDFACGDVLVAAGHRLSARDIGMAASGNHPWVAVHRAPRVAILATGDEIALPGEPIPLGGVVSSNAHALAALVRASGGEASILPIAADDLAALGDTAAAAAGFDLLLTTGGASVGDHDLVRPGLAARGMALDFWKIAMRPGKPLLHGRMGALPVIGLPGNPVSAMVTAILFVTAAIERLSGLPGHAPPIEAMALAAPLPANDHRHDHLRARFAALPDGTSGIAAFDRQDSSLMRRMAAADGLILRAPHAPACPMGTMVEVIRFDRIGI